MTKTLDIVLPCYNPLPDWAETVVNSMSAIQTQLPNTNIRLYIVNDGSTKPIQQKDIDYIQRNIQNFTYLDYSKNRGKGHALREGIRHCKGDYSIYTDIDFPYTTDSLVKIFQQLCQQDVEVVIGVRDEHYYKNVPPARKRISKVFRFLLKFFFRLPVSDTQCGLKGFKAEARSIFLSTTINRYLFDLEFLHLAARKFSNKIVPIQVELKPGIVFSKMHINTLAREGWGFIKIFFRSLLKQK